MGNQTVRLRFDRMCCEAYASDRKVNLIRSGFQYKLISIKLMRRRNQAGVQVNQRFMFVTEEKV